MSTITRIKCKTDNCYLISEGRNAILIDTGSRQCLDLVIAECDKYDLKLIVLTHVHFDRQSLKCYGLTGRLVLGLSLKVLRETKVERPSNIIYVKDGDSLNEYGINAKIVELPGHTNGSIGVDVEEKHLLVGDALDNWVFPGMGHLYYNLEDIKKSYDKIKGLGPRTLYFGHGKPVKQ